MYVLCAIFWLEIKDKLIQSNLIFYLNSYLIEKDLAYAVFG